MSLSSPHDLAMHVQFQPAPMQATTACNPDRSTQCKTGGKGVPQAGTVQYSTDCTAENRQYCPCVCDSTLPVGSRQQPGCTSAVRDRPSCADCCRSWKARDALRPFTYVTSPPWGKTHTTMLQESALCITHQHIIVPSGNQLPHTGRNSHVSSTNHNNGVTNPQRFAHTAMHMFIRHPTHMPLQTTIPPSPTQLVEPSTSSISGPSVPLHKVHLYGHLGLDGLDCLQGCGLAAAIKLKQDLPSTDGGCPVVQGTLTLAHAHLQDTHKASTESVRSVSR